MPDLPRDLRYARHDAVAGFGARGQDAVRAGAVRIELAPGRPSPPALADRDAARFAATFLAAGGVGALAVAGADADELAALAEHGPDVRFTADPASPLSLPAPPPWWPAADGDATALALYRGATAAARWMLAAAAAEPIPPDLVATVRRHARAAFPRECCGYLAGPRDAALDEVVACRNAATTDDAFSIDGADLLGLVRSLDGPRPARVIYHSHPNGRAYFSARDRAAAATAGGPVYPVAHLVVGVDATGIRDTAVFAWDGAGYAEVARYPAC